MDSPFYSEKGILISCLNDNETGDELKPAFSDDEIEEAYYYEVCHIISRFEPQVHK